VQAVLRDYPPVFFYEDRSSDGDATEALSGKQKAYLGRLLRYDLACPPELTRGPLYRVRLIRTGEERAVLYRVYSHTLLDLQTILNTVHELLGSGEIRPDDRRMVRHFAHLLHGAREEAEAYWSRLFDGHLTVVPAPVKRDIKPSVRSLKAGGGALREQMPAFCRERGVTLAAVLHFCLARALLSLTEENSCTFFSVSGGRSGTEMELAGNFTHTFPFVFKRGDSLRDCQEQLVRSGAYAWVWSLPGLFPSPVQGKNVLILDIAGVYEKQSGMDDRNLSVTDALDGIGLKAVYLQRQRQAELDADRLMVEYGPASRHLFFGTYDPSRVDENFAAGLFESLARELEALLKGET